MGVGARNVEGWLVACARPHQKKRKKIPTPKKKDKKNKAHKATGGNIRRVNPRNSQVQQQKKAKKKTIKVVAVTWVGSAAAGRLAEGRKSQFTTFTR
jgi:hypothetical protein